MKTLSHIEEHHPHLIQRIVWVWNYPEALAFLEKMLLQDRNGRDGFNMQAFAEIVLLIDVAKEKLNIPIFPQNIHKDYLR